jgi:hypothetical protein
MTRMIRALRLLAVIVAAAMATPARAEVPAPVINEPLFADAQHLRVHGLADGSEVTITADGEDRGTLVVPRDAAVIPLTKPLKANQRVEAVATRGSETARSIPAIVQKVPAPLAVPAVKRAQPRGK